MSQKKEIENLHPHIRIMLNTYERMFGPGNYKLLCYIDETGSLQKACQKMGLSYSKGMKMIKNVEKQLGYPLVERWSGGKHGGGSCISDKGRQFLEQYRTLVEDVERYTCKKFNEIFNEENKENYHEID